MTEYTRFRNKNRGYMKLRVWHKAIELYKLVCRIVYLESLEKKRDEGSWVTRATENIDDHHPQEAQ
ncbi:hypothetical protein L0337_01575 [candidate division KSB1 bacterium]|nr:hypothetical protein [candidate division KSB1 bacterium]